ncbi:hypothetical protein MJ904_21420 [Massilia sp. MB5]|uniref:hypothetical protein n=1 Tax=Massilia sp. MB5 TaxID=2919578 RepID=UPI001F0E38E4|nr:hypothetical protein [Massilia sp. MB5]UMR29588.1 hypothetical protein MJ904_21420 [Massilia sp. MB5]
MFFSLKKPILFLTTSFLLAGCGAPPKIHTQKFSAPKTIAIVDTSEMKNIAMVGLFIAGGRHFTSEIDAFFVAGSTGDTKSSAAPPAIVDDILANHNLQSSLAPRQSVGSAMASGAAAGAIGGMIQGAADETFKKSQNYHQEVLKRVPGLSLKSELMKSLRTEFEAKGIQTSIVANSDSLAPRLRWPAREADGQVWQAAPNDHLPVVNADILMQISPIAVWYAPGQLNNYRRGVGIGVALYDGRTKQFLGQQTFSFSASAWQDEYTRYDSLVEAGPVAAGQMREALLSLVPQIVAVVSRSEPATER